MNLNELQKRWISGENFSFVFFWGHKSGFKLTETCFSQWYPAVFKDDDRTYNCAEQYMMAQKAILFDDIEVLDKIMKSSDPATIKKLGREVKNFDATIWDNACRNIVVRGNFLKFSQNEDLKNFLLATNDAVLVEASPYDAIWGIKMRKEDPLSKNPMNWQGTNYLGFALMDVREQIKNTSC